jgi:hypothetical protein
VSLQVFQKSRSHLTIRGAKMVTCIKFHTEGCQILGTSVQNVVAVTIRCPGFVHPCFKVCFLFGQKQLKRVINGQLHVS